MTFVFFYFFVPIENNFIVSNYNNKNIVCFSFVDMLNLKFLIIVIVYFIEIKCDSLSAIQCLDRGFVSENLPCSNCLDLTQFRLNELQQTCQQCCTQTNQDDEEEEKINKYHRAVLTVCTCKFGRYPQIEAFVRGDRARRFPSFSFKHIPGAEPVLHLYNDRDEEIRSLGIEKWDTDTITAFLEENLQV